MRTFPALFLLSASLFLHLAACTTEDPDGTGGGTPQGGPVCTEPTAVPCEDQVIQGMNLQADIAPGLITSTPEGDGWRAVIDATAGGPFATDPDSYVYARFTDAGLEKVDLSDEDSIASMDWDIAFRRYIIRINSGNSGPSCVGGARIPGDPAYDDVTVAPAITYHADEYFTDSCDFIPDGSGLADSPATVLSGYWTYPGCVSMSHLVYALQLADGATVKLTVERYYNPDVQQECDTTGAIPMSNTGSGTIEMRWAFLQ